MSDKTLDQLITSIKKEGIEAAEDESRKILENARSQAHKIVESAEEERKLILAEAEKEARATRHKGEIALRQASRDYSLSVRNELLKMLHAVLEAETKNTFKPEILKTAIVKVIENIGSDTEVVLSPEFSKELAAYIKEQLKSSNKAVSIVQDNKLLRGFTISKGNEGWSYTISPEDVAAELKGHLNDSWLDILNKAS